MPEKCSILTFDDGLREHAETIAPYLSSRGLRGLFNVCPTIFDGLPSTPQIIHFASAYYGVRRFMFLFKPYVDGRGGIELFNRLFADDDFQLNTNSGAISLLGKLKKTINHLTPYAVSRAALIDFWEEKLKLDLPDIMSRVFMTREQFVSLAERHDIGVHTRTHYPIKTSSFDREIFISEIVEGKSLLERIANQPITSFAYPYGDAGSVIYDQARLKGFKTLESVD